MSQGIERHKAAGWEKSEDPCMKSRFRDFKYTMHAC
jgi:hypothetical protein